MSSVRFPEPTHEALRAWSVATGRPANAVLHDALEAVVTAPAAVVRQTELVVAPAGAGRPLTVSEADRDLWAEAGAALATVTTQRSLGSVVRALVVLRLEQEATTAH